jgi:hypothetical protein
MTGAVRGDGLPAVVVSRPVWRTGQETARLRTQGSIRSRIDFTIHPGFTWAICLPDRRLREPPFRLASTLQHAPRREPVMPVVGLPRAALARRVRERSPTRRAPTGATGASTDTRRWPAGRVRAASRTCAGASRRSDWPARGPGGRRRCRTCRRCRGWPSSRRCGLKCVISRCRSTKLAGSDPRASSSQPGPLCSAKQRAPATSSNGRTRSKPGERSRVLRRAGLPAHTRPKSSSRPGWRPEAASRSPRAGDGSARPRRATHHPAVV